jgi:hypothetical protein
LCCFNKFVNHGGRQGNVVQALVQWHHPLASSEARDVLHWAMHPASYHRIRMVIEIASKFPTFFVVVNYLFAHNLS